MNNYDPKQLESKWQKIWAETGLYKTDEGPGKLKYYCLVMFPYPSGDLHTGHWYNFGPGDTVARFHRMQGRAVLHPIGFDAFGLPAENAAIKRNIPPAKWTDQNIVSMTKQLRAIGAMYDWDRLVVTSRADYYRWTQWLFLELYKRGLAYRAKGWQNWCPKDQTVLANEQVVGENNVCERCGTPVIKKELEQWFFKITDYADRLLNDLGTVEWPSRVKTMQENWIGRSIGAQIEFEVEEGNHKVEVFTTRPETLYGATYLVLAPDHFLVEKITTKKQAAEVKAYQGKTARETELERLEAEKEKTGVFTGAYATNPATKEKIPVWIADYVLTSYGTGAIMAVPAHDQRDYDFAKKFDLPVKEVIEAQEIPYAGEGKLINSRKYDGTSSAEAREKIAAQFGREQVNYRLRDWLISRQRYWGAPIPIIYCDKCGIVPVPETDLPVELPLDVEFEPTGQSPLATRPDFYEAACPNCGGKARRETDTMDTFVDSSWYFLRYPNTKIDSAAFDHQAVERWMPVDQYIGGIEHAILHLLYSRFVTKVLYDAGYIKFEEPFKRLFNQGLILGPDGQKMSKSRGNVINPDDWVKDYGADTFRMYLMFMGPYDQGGPFNPSGIDGTKRFLNRVWALVRDHLAAKDEAASASLETALLSVTHKALKRVTVDLEKFGFNTAIAAQMELVNEMYKLKLELPLGSTAWRQSIELLLEMLAPFAPHITEELWQQLGHEESIHLSGWPVFDPQLVTEELVQIAVQVNGRVRGSIEVEATLEQEAVAKLASKHGLVAKHLEGKEIVKTIYVPQKIINFVTRLN